MVRDQKEFEEHLDDIRESDDPDENHIQERIERLDKIAEKEHNNPPYSYSLPLRIGIGLVVLVASFALAASMPASTGMASRLFVVSFPLFLTLMVFSKTNIALRREFVRIMKNAAEEASQEQQQSTPQSKTEQVVCQSCGWKNPKNNNFCHDCGSELS